MKCRQLKFIVCPDIPDHIHQKRFQSFSNQVGKNHDWRSMASEQYALEYMGLKKILCEEEAFIDKYASQGVRVPECVAQDPIHPDRIITVEVKRICGNQLPLDFTGQSRRKLRKRNQLVWPWGTTIWNSLNKAHPQIIEDFGVQRHHVVFVVPNSLTQRSLQRLCDRIQVWVTKSLEKDSTPLKHIIVHIIQGDDTLFDRF